MVKSISDRYRFKRFADTATTDKGNAINNPIAFWCVSGFLFVWGVAYFGLVIFSFFIATPEHWAALVSEGRIKAEYVVYIGDIPAWVIGITLVAALSRLLGGAALLMHNSWALPSYGVSLVLVAIIMFRGFVLADVASVIRGSQVALEIAFFALSGFAVWYAYVNTNNGTLT